ncbi:MAG: pallilysin-related adhesin, partial [Treponema sp.]|nr:pallilysin-related adhesin [Treponema sp.]
MKSRTIPLLFLIIAIVLGGIFFISRKFFVQSEKTLTRAKIVTPVASETTETGTDSQSASLENEKYETFVPLYTGETLISTLTLDINNDGYDDEVILIRKINSQNLWLVPALIDQDTGVYKRLEPISTEFTRTRTLSYTGMDITGDHKNSLIYQGVKDDGNYVMEIYMYKQEGSLDGMVNIGDFTCDGTVFIQQTERSESYELSMSKGEAYSVWVYKSEAKDDSKSTGGQNQIQEEYKWNSAAQKYELA